MFKCNFSAYEGSEKYLFISYAHKDSDMVYPIIERLNAEGYRVWYDDGITPGSEWPENIAIHLENAETFIFFASPNSVSSDNCKREVNFALSRNKKFFTISLVPTELTLGLELQISTQQNILMYEYDDMNKFYDTIFAASSLAPCKRYEGEEDVKQNLSQGTTAGTAPAQKRTNEMKPAKAKKGNKKVLFIALGACAALAVVVALILLVIVPKIAKREIKLDNGQTVYANTTYLNFFSNSVITSNDISKLKNLKDITSIELNNCTLESDVDLSTLKCLPNVNSLTIEATEIQDYSFLSQMTSLNELQVRDTSFTGDLSILPAEEISFIGLTNAGEVDINGLTNCKKINTLEIYDTSVKEITNPLPGSIIDLSLSGCGLTNTDFLTSSKIEYISELDLSDNDISDISFLSKYADSIYSLNLSDTNIDKSSLPIIQCCKNLYKLRLNNVPVEDLSIISAMNNLYELELSGCGLSSLENGNLSVKRFKRLVLSDNNLTNIDVLSTILEEDSYGMDVLDISNNKITSVASLPINDYALFAAFGNDIDFSNQNNVKFFEDATFKNLFINYYDGLENANVYYMIVIVDGTAENQASLISKGCECTCQPSSETYVKDIFVSTDYDVSMW